MKLCEGVLHCALALGDAEAEDWSTMVWWTRQHADADEADESPRPSRPPLQAAVPSTKLLVDPPFDFRQRNLSVDVADAAQSRWWEIKTSGTRERLEWCLKGTRYMLDIYHALKSIYG